MKTYRSHVVLLLISGLFYLWTLAPGIIAGDSASFAVDVQQLKLTEAHKLRLGRADNHPFYLVVGKLFSYLPFELAYSLNLMSAFFGLLTILVVFLVIRHLSESPLAALFGAFSLMVSHAFWQHSVIAEVYTLNAFFVAVLLYLVLTQMTQRWFPALFLIVVVSGLLNHLILALVLPALCVYIFIHLTAKSRKRVLWLGGGSACLLLLGSIAAVLLWPHEIRTWLHAMLIGPPPIKHYLLLPDGITPLLRELLFYILYLCYQFPLGGVLIGILGIVTLAERHRAAAVLTGMMLLCNAVFFLKTTSWASYGGSKYTFYISDYTLFAVYIGCGASSLLKGLNSYVSKKVGPGKALWLSRGAVTASVVLTVMLYAVMPSLLSVLKIDVLHARTLAYRDNNSFFLNPNKRGWYGDRIFGEEILEQSRQHAVIFADFTPYSILKYLLEVEKKRPDITLVMCHKRLKIREQVDALRQEQPDRPVYLADTNSYYNLKGLDELYMIRPYVSFFEILTRK